MSCDTYIHFCVFGTNLTSSNHFQYAYVTLVYLKIDNNDRYRLINKIHHWKPI